MAISNAIDPREAEPRLTRWLATKLPEAEVSEVAVPPASGGSNETVFFTAAWNEGGTERKERMVARVLPSGVALFPSYDLESEYRLIRTMAERTAVPVPAVRWVERDTAVFGAPFMAMPFVGGRVLGDDPPFTAAGWFLELTPEQQATVHDNGLQALAQIHAVDWRELGLDFLDRPEHGRRGIDQQIGWWESFFRWAAGGESYPTIAAAFDWVHQNKPDEESLVLGWGDARLGNIIFSDDLSVAAVLDWEMAGLVSPEVDLAWWLFLNRHHCEGIGVPRPAGLPSDKATVRRYEELTGRRVQNLHFHQVFAGVRMASLMVRVAHLMITEGLVPSDSTMALNNPASQMLAELLGLPAPDAAQSTTFAGVFQNRT